MKIELNYYEVMEAVDMYLFQKYKMQVDMYEDTELCETETTTFIRQPKKHKNGKDVKNEHGYTMYETVGEEKNTTAFKQDDSFIFHLFRQDD